MSLEESRTPPDSEARRQYLAHKQRLGRIAAAAARTYADRARAAVTPPKPQPVPVVAKPDPVSEWVARQKQIPITGIKEPWFSIIDDVEFVDKPPPSILFIQGRVAKYFGLTRHDLICAGRTSRLVLPRQIAMYLVRKLTLWSYPEVGRKFGGRDHSTALHAERRITELIPENPAIATAVRFLEKDITGTWS